jgi:hypothetical protein
MFAAGLAIVLGVWLTVAPAVLGYSAAARTNDQIVGPLIATFATIALAQATRPLRLLNLPLALWLLVAPLVLRYPQTLATHSIALGIVLGFLAVRPVRPRRRQGGGWRAIRGSGAI